MDLVTVATFDTPPRAHLAIGLLSETGIDGMLQNEEIVAGAWDMGQASQGVQVRVDRAHAQRAFALIEKAAFHGGVASDGLAPEFEGDDDPFSTLPEVRSLKHSARRALLSAAVGHSFPPLTIYSLWVLFDLGTRSNRPRATPSIRWQLFVAVVLNSLTIAGYAVLAGLIGSS